MISFEPRSSGSSFFPFHRFIDEMGAGASAKVEELAGADAGMKEAFEKLSEDARKAFWEVVAKDGVEAAIKSDETVSAAHGKLSEEDQKKFCDDVKAVFDKGEEAEAAPEEAKEE